MHYNDIKILFEDNHILVVLKPQGIPSQADKSGDADMLTLLKTYIKEKYLKPGNVYLGLVHRLDRPTGGVMVFAKSSKAAARLSEQVREGELEKKYLAVLASRPNQNRARLTHYLQKDEATNTVRAVPMSTEGAKRAVLDYEIISEDTELGMYLADIKLYTGRSHQIRVQMSAVGGALFGDVKYGRGPIGQLALWAYDLRFKHPTEDKIMRFRAFPPESSPWTEFNLDKLIGLTKPVE